MALEQVMAGAVAMGFAVAGVFFLRFWRDSGDRLFVLFALAFLVMAANRVGIALSESPGVREGQYWVRLLAFALILAAVLDKNRPRRPPAGGRGEVA